MTNTNPQPAARKKWPWIVGAVVVLLVVLWVVGTLAGPPAEDQGAAADLEPATSSSVAPPTSSTTEATSSTAPSTTTSASSTTTSEATTERPTGPSESEVTAWARSQAGLSPDGGYEATGGWMDTLVGARVEGDRLYIRLQVDRSDKRDAENAERLYVNTLKIDRPSWGENLKWVIVEDGAGVVITQQSV